MAPHGTQPKVGDIMRHAVFDTILTPIKEVVPCPTASNPHKVKVRIMKDDTWITLWFWYTPWQLMQQTDATEQQDKPDRLPDVELVISAAQRHGADSEPDHEVGDLQDCLRVAVGLLDDEQRLRFFVEEPC